MGVLPANQAVNEIPALPMPSPVPQVDDTHGGTVDPRSSMVNHFIYVFRTDDQFVSLINGTPVNQQGTWLRYNYPVV